MKACEVCVDCFLSPKVEVREDRSGDDRELARETFPENKGRKILAFTGLTKNAIDARDRTF